VLLLLLGLGVIVVGAELLVTGSVSMARQFDVSEAVIGLTIIAIGTSAPEFVTTIVSTVRGNRDIAIGNLIGSSICNIGIVLGVTVLVAPGRVPVPDDVLAADMILLAAVAAITVPVFVSGSRVSRIEGALFVAAYVAYVTWLLTTRI
jgi:cation:H+ antiporter